MNLHRRKLFVTIRNQMNVKPEEAFDAIFGSWLATGAFDKEALFKRPRGYGFRFKKDQEAQSRRLHKNNLIIKKAAKRYLRNADDLHILKLNDENIKIAVKYIVENRFDCEIEMNADILKLFAKHYAEDAFAFINAIKTTSKEPLIYTPKGKYLTNENQVAEYKRKLDARIEVAKEENRKVFAADYLPRFPNIDQVCGTAGSTELGELWGRVREEFNDVHVHIPETIKMSKNRGGHANTEIKWNFSTVAITGSVEAKGNLSKSYQDHLLAEIGLPSEYLDNVSDSFSIHGSVFSEEKIKEIQMKQRNFTPEQIEDFKGDFTIFDLSNGNPEVKALANLAETMIQSKPTGTDVDPSKLGYFHGMKAPLDTVDAVAELTLSFTATPTKDRYEAGKAYTAANIEKVTTITELFEVFKEASRLSGDYYDTQVFEFKYGVHIAAKDLDLDLVALAMWLDLLKKAEVEELTFKDEEDRIDQLVQMNVDIDRATDISTWYEPDIQKEYFVIPLEKWKSLCAGL